MPVAPADSSFSPQPNGDAFAGLRVTGIDFVVHRTTDRGWAVRDLVYPNVHTLVWAVSGRATYTTGAGPWGVSAGELLFFPAGMRRSGRSDPQDPWAFVAIGFFLSPGSQAKRTAARLAALPRTASPPADADVAAAVGQLDRQWHAQLPGAQLCCGGIVSRLLGLYVQAASRPAGQDARPALSRVIELLRHSPQQQYSVDTLARHAGLSPSRFRVLFRRATGTSALKFQNGIRVRRAAALLRSGEHSVAEVAELVGYRDIFYFSRQFKQLMGVPPSAYRPADQGVCQPHWKRPGLISVGPACCRDATR